MNKPDCSIIIPAYNTEDTISRSIRSIFTDSGGDYRYEVLIVDDGSSDNTAQIVRDLSEEYPCIRLIQKENGGVSSARNMGLNAAQGHFVYLMDADDELIRPALDKIVRRAYSVGADMMIADYEQVKDDSGEAEYVAADLPANETLDEAFIRTKILPLFVDGDTRTLSSVWNKLYVRRLISDAGLTFNEGRTHGEDWEFNIQFLQKAKTIYYDNILLYRYENRGIPNLSKYKKSLAQGYAHSYRLLSDMIRTYSLDENDRLIQKKLENKIAYNFISVLKMDEVSFEEKKNLLRMEEAKAVFSDLADSDRDTLAALQLSRKDKAAFGLLSRGMLQLAVKLI